MQGETQQLLQPRPGTCGRHAVRLRQALHAPRLLQPEGVSYASSQLTPRCFFLLISHARAAITTIHVTLFLIFILNYTITVSLPSHAFLVTHGFHPRLPDLVERLHLAGSEHAAAPHLGLPLQPMLAQPLSGPVDFRSDGPLPPRTGRTTTAEIDDAPSACWRLDNPPRPRVSTQDTSGPRK